MHWHVQFRPRRAEFLAVLKGREEHSEAREARAEAREKKRDKRDAATTHMLGRLGNGITELLKRVPSAAVRAEDDGIAEGASPDSDDNDDDFAEPTAPGRPCPEVGTAAASGSSASDREASKGSESSVGTGASESGTVLSFSNPLLYRIALRMCMCMCSRRRLPRWTCERPA